MDGQLVQFPGEPPKSFDPFCHGTRKFLGPGETFADDRSNRSRDQKVSRRFSLLAQI
jgi:hypothetical protein